jgi:hypothetical protein
VYSYLDARGDFLVVGDLMKSITVLRYNTASGGAPSLESVGSEPSANWMTAVAMLDDATFVGAEHHFNLFTAVRNAGATADEERLRLDVVGEFHVGEMINRMRPGSLVMLPTAEAEDGAAGGGRAGGMDIDDGGAAGDDEDADLTRTSKRARKEGAAAGSFNAAASSSSASAAGRGVGGGAASSHAAPRPRLIYATNSGSLGVLISLPPPLYKYLNRAQRALTSVVQGVGGLSHRAWRAHYNDKKAARFLPGGEEEAGPKAYIDGDLLETFLDLARPQQEAVVAAMTAASASTAAAAGGSGGAAAGGAGAASAASASSSSSAGAAAADAAAPTTVEELTKIVEDLSRLH